MDVPEVAVLELPEVEVDVEEEDGAEVTEEEAEETVAEPEDEATAPPLARVGVWPGAQVAAVGRALASPTEPQMALANWMVAAEYDQLLLRGNPPGIHVHTLLAGSVTSFGHTAS